MINIIVIAHAEIANSFAHCAEHILNKRVKNLHILAVRKTEGIETILKKAEELIAKIDSDHQILILTDLFGATPSNIGSKLVRRGSVELITGLNMAMLIRAISYTKCSLETCIDKVLDGAHSGIVYINGDKNEN